METLYKSYTSLKSDKVLGCGETRTINDDNKVHSILTALRKALEEQIKETPARELCILTTLAKSNPPDLEEALRRIKVIRGMELSTTTDLRRVTYPSSEESLRHLLSLSDSDAAFEAALGLYDLNFAAIVALNSQKDPKEFLALLEELKSMPTFLMQFNIDLKLRRYESVLRHIVSAGAPYYGDCMNLMKKVLELYPLGLQLIVDLPKRQQVLESWGDHLYATKCFELVHYSMTLKDKCCEKLAQYFELNSLLTVVIIGSDGKTLQSNFREAIEEQSIHGNDDEEFP